MKYFALVFVLLSLVSCSSNDSVSEEVSESEIERYFGNFPESPFLDLQFDEPIEQSQLKLSNQKFRQQEFQEDDWRTEDEKVEVLFHDQEKLAQFKIFFFDKKEEFLDELELKMTDSASKSEKMDSFSVYSFDTDRTKYTVTLFSFENLIRLQFNILKSH
ncbi:MAG: hypothetical protein ACI857_001297 [Arenicella sp.]|jgi:hypothetical protein